MEGVYRSAAPRRPGEGRMVHSSYRIHASRLRALIANIPASSISQGLAGFKEDGGGDYGDTGTVVATGETHMECSPSDESGLGMVLS